MLPAIARRKLLFLAFVALMMVGVACSTPTAAPTAPPPPQTNQGNAAPNAPTTAAAPKAKEELIVVAPDEPKSVCPMFYLSQKTFFIDPTVSWGLTTIDWKNGTVVARIAEKWEMVQPNQWRFYLKKDLKWSNGQPLTAEDVAWNINDQTDPDAHPAAEQPRIQRYLQGKNLAKAIDPYTVEVDTKEPHPIMPNDVLFLNLVEPKSYKADPAACDEKPISNGPYVPIEHKIGEYIRFQANSYFQPQPEFKYVKMVFRKEASVRAAMVAKGEADVAFNIGADMAKLTPKSTSQMTAEVLLVQLDTRFHPNFKDKRFRQALVYAINCEEIIKTIQGGYGKCAAIQTTPGSVGIPADMQPYGYNPDKAKQLLKEAGMEGAAFTFYVRLIGRFPFESETYQAIVGYWTKVGLKVNLQVMEGAAYNQWAKTGTGLGPDAKAPTESGNPTYAFPEWTGNMDIPSGLAGWLTCKGARSRYCNAEFDALMEKGQAATGEERTKLAEQVSRMLYDEVPFLPLFTLNIVAGMSKDLDYVPTPDSELRIHDIHVLK